MLKLEHFRKLFDYIINPTVNNFRYLQFFKGIHRGSRAFIIGTGPSLLETNLSSLKEEITFGVNGLCLYDGLDFDPTYYCISDPEAYKKFGKYAEQLSSIKFLSVPPCPRPPRGNWIQIPLDRTHQVMNGYFAGTGKHMLKTYWGRTVVIDLCLQLAFYMGFAKVYLVGCDCGPSHGRLHAYDDPMERKVSTPYHPDIFKSYKVCRHVFQLAGREIVNATVGGRLEVFKRQKLEDVLKEPKYCFTQMIDDSELRKYVKVKKDVPDDSPLSIAVILERIERVRDLGIEGFKVITS